MELDTTISHVCDRFFFGKCLNNYIVYYRNNVFKKQQHVGIQTLSFKLVNYKYKNQIRYIKIE